MQYARLQSSFVSISSSPTPTSNVVGEYPSLYGGGYYILQASNTNTGDVYFSEIASVNTDNDVYYNEFADLQTNVGLGTVGF